MAFCFYHYLRSPFIVGSCVVFMIMISMVFVQAIPSEASVTEKVIILLVLEFCAAALFAGSTVLSVSSRKNKTILTDHTLILSDQNFVEQTVFNRTEQTWESVQKLTRTRTHIFIYIAQYMAHVIPRRAFATEADWDAFFTYCKTRTDR
ncbi:MAG TPA: YcxB family protein [Candidatus Acidoferrum sp.]|nr:YcxB family protein [Candidatus Acidoferrum sp.]